MANKKHLAIIKQGVDVWNKWRTENPHIVPDLEGANLSKKELPEINFSDSNLQSVNLDKTILENANLKNANLSKTIALNTNFRQANLTGACLEDWNINNLTIFDNIICKYIFFEKNQKKRIPEVGNFTSEEFKNLYIKFFKTRELIFSNKIDWKAFFIFFNNEYNEVVANYNEALGIVKKKYEFQILTKDEQIREYKQQIEFLKNRIKFLNESILELTSINKDQNIS